MMKFGTPIGAAPKSAIETDGLAFVGVPSGLRISGVILVAGPIVTLTLGFRVVRRR